MLLIDKGIGESEETAVRLQLIQIAGCHSFYDSLAENGRLTTTKTILQTALGSSCFPHSSLHFLYN